jgi:hypothetical protein
MGYNCERKWISLAFWRVRWKQNKDILERKFGI